MLRSLLAGNKKKSRKQDTTRLVILMGFFLIASSIVLVRVFMLAVVSHEEYSIIAERQYGLNKTLPSRRGKIYFQDKFGHYIVAAEDREVKTLVASPKNITDPIAAADLLSRNLNISRPILEERLTKKDDPYEVIAKGLPEATTTAIAALKINGIGLIPEIKRFYPHKELAAHVLGFRGYSEKFGVWRGVYGVEKEFDSFLASKGAEPVKDAGPAAKWFSMGMGAGINPTAGTDVLLTIDYNIQERTEEELTALIKKWDAESGLIIILEPASGRILSLASSRKFDPNEYAKVDDYSVFKNSAVESMYEPGSVFKPITMAAAINDGAVTPETTYYDPGVIKFGSYSIFNFDLKSYGTQTMTQVLEKSLNTGAVHVGRLLGKEQFKGYVDAFGFGKTTGSDLPNEIFGNIANLEYNRDLEYATASFGQGIAVTPLQMASAIGALANGGKLMQPHVVDAVIDVEGTLRRFDPHERGIVVRKETAETLTKMLVSVVRVGYENRAGVKGYFVAGKTGTAQIPNADRRGYSTDVIHTFVGYAPAFSPRFLVYMQLNRPLGNRFAANTLTRAFHNLGEFILNYYEVSPDEK